MSKCSRLFTPTNNKSRCYRFPMRESLRESYIEILSKQKGQPYLAEKTVQTITEWLGDGSFKKDFSLVPLYAMYDYHENATKNAAPVMVKMLNMNYDEDLKHIQDTLHSLSIPCDCE